MVEFPKYVKINDLDLVMAIREGMNPMLEWYDKKHNNLPYFWNYISGPKYGNSHHKSYSCVHSMGRWLDALVNAEAITGEVVPQEIYDQLAFWAYEIFNNDTGMMANLNVNTFEWEKVCDLHNLREAMYAFVALLKKNPNDQKAKKGAEHLIDMVDRYTDFETGNWKTDLYERECGGKVECGASSEREVYRFSSTLGRYIGGLVRLYMVYPYDKALDQAIRLTDTALKNVLLDDGEFDRERFAEHLHSTSSMISGIAMLGSLIQNQEILCRVKKFMENGYYQVATDFGWCLENDKRVDNWVGEINNTGDYLEACLCLGKAGYEEYYDRADKMIRCHLLPSQLLDVSFISDEESEDDSISKMATRMKGAFGFPCPYGHEYEPGSEISFNWDIVGGGVSSLCFDKKRDLENSIKNMKIISQYAEEYDIMMGMEVLNRFEGYMLNTCDEALAYVEEVGSSNVGVMLDTFHMNIEEDNIAAAIRKAGDRLCHFHIGEGNRKVPGKGMLPWNEIGQALRDINYQHAAVMEPFVMQGGTVGHDIKIWRDIIGNCSEVTLDMDAQSALHFVKHVFEV